MWSEHVIFSVYFVEYECLKLRTTPRSQFKLKIKINEVSVMWFSHKCHWRIQQNKTTTASKHKTCLWKKKKHWWKIKMASSWDGQITLGAQKQAVVLLNSCLNSERSVMNHRNLRFSSKNWVSNQIRSSFVPKISVSTFITRL